MILALATAACGTAADQASFTAPPFPDAGPSLAVALLQPLPGASFSIGSDIPVIAAIQALGSPVTSCELLLGDAGFRLQPPIQSTETWNIAATSPRFDAGLYELEVTVGNAAGQTAIATRTISISP